MIQVSSQDVALAFQAKRFPSLDGVRALSIGMVMIAHGLSGRINTEGAFHQLLDLGYLGVTIFFVLSGFLITALLEREEIQHGSVSLHDFYVRRIFRIAPPFYVFLLVMLVLKLVGGVNAEWQAFVAGAAFVVDYVPTGSFSLQHLWSLGVEEKFYLVWPLFFFLPKRYRLSVALIVIASVPVIRVMSYFVVPGLRGWERTMFHTRLDALMIGCSLAMMWRQHPKLIAIWVRRGSWLPIGSLGIMLVLNPLLREHLRGGWDLPFGMTVDAVCAAMFIAWVVANHDSAIGKALNHTAVVTVGTWSYSLYLWQQLFVNPHNTLLGGSISFAVFVSFVCAWLSHRFIEQPALLYRSRYLSQPKRSIA